MINRVLFETKKFKKQEKYALTITLPSTRYYYALLKEIEEIQLDNKVVYWPRDVISLTEVDIAATTALKQIFSS